MKKTPKKSTPAPQPDAEVEPVVSESEVKSELDSATEEPAALSEEAPAEPAAEAAPLAPAKISESAPKLGRPHFNSWWVAGTALAAVILVALIYNTVYAGKIFPGIRADGVYLGGLSQPEASKMLAKRTRDFSGRPLVIQNASSIWKINLPDLGLQYNTDRAAELAYQYGRRGNVLRRAWTQLRTLATRTTNIAVYSYNSAKLSPYLSSITDDIDRPVTNARLDFSSGDVTIQPSATGVRLDLGSLVIKLQNALAQTDAGLISAPVYTVLPAVNAASLEPLRAQARAYTSAPLSLQVGLRTIQVDQSTIISWLAVTDETPPTLVTGPRLRDFFPRQTIPANLALDETKLAGYVSDLAAQTDQEARDAQLAIQDGHASVFVPSRTGQKLDQAKAVTAIKSAITKSAGARSLVLAVQTIQPQVREDNLNNLGINELLSEGVTYFPGSPIDRMTNIRVGASKFNGVLLKPGDTFSFGALLGDVGPAQGYAPALVILNNHEEKQYGGGLCQVSSTAYRAALLAGLPITERHNHSFAVSFYTAPFGVPGVDATIYYPQVDLKFLNDTGHYILIQTVLSGTTLKFDFYGTKTKSGQLRGPNFISPTNGDGWNPTVPSHTIFYRDVLDLSGNVVKTDTINTYYQSSLDFPVTPQFN